MTIIKETFLTDFSVKKCLINFRDVKDFPAVFESKTPSLAKLKSEIGFEAVCAWIEMWLINLRESVNVGKKMTDSQCQETAIILLEDYPTLKIVDINLIFRKAKTGGFGTIYDRIDVTVISEWFKKYFNERCEVAEGISLREHDKEKYDEMKYGSERSSQSRNDDDYDRFKINHITAKMFKPE